jgi:Protein of unknown function (DUF3343)
MLFLFRSTRDVMAAEKIVRSAAIPCQIIPVPRNISSECGMGIRIDTSYLGTASEILAKLNPEIYDE